MSCPSPSCLCALCFRANYISVPFRWTASPTSFFPSRPRGTRVCRRFGKRGADSRARAVAGTGVPLTRLRLRRMAVSGGRVAPRAAVSRSGSRSRLQPVRRGPDMGDDTGPAPAARTHAPAVGRRTSVRRREAAACGQSGAVARETAVARSTRCRRPHASRAPGPRDGERLPVSAST